MSYNQPIPTTLADDEVHVWTVPLAKSGEQGAGSREEPETLNSTLRAPCSTLSAFERERAERFLRDDLRRRFVVAHAALRTILGRYLGLKPEDVPIENDPLGKPRLKGGWGKGEGGKPASLSSDSSLLLPPSDLPLSLRFNLSHSGELAVVAVTRSSEIGVDVERLRAVRYPEQLANRYFTPSETAAILKAEDGSLKDEEKQGHHSSFNNQPPTVSRDAAFLAIWTAKEAILKAVGTGLALPLASFSVLQTADPQRVKLAARHPAPSPQSPAPTPHRDWHLARVDVGAGYLAAVATNAPKTLRPTFRYPDDLA